MDDTHTKARATAQALIQAYIPPDARGVDKRALYYALVEVLTEAQQGFRSKYASPSETHETA